MELQIADAIVQFEQDTGMTVRTIEVRRPSIVASTGNPIEAYAEVLLRRE